jgi:hypothetical protein
MEILINDDFSENNIFRFSDKNSETLVFIKSKKNRVNNV